MSLVRPARLAAHPLLRPIAVLALAVTTAGVVSVVDPNESGHYPTCPFLAATGRYCPGCGSLRAIHALGLGQIDRAIGHNALTVAMVPVLAYLWLRWTIAEVAGRPARTRPADARLIWMLLVVVVAFWAARNLPLGSALAP